MEVYRITFHSPDGVRYQTNLEGRNLEDIKEKIHAALYSPSDTMAHFSIENSDKKYFTVKHKHVSFIEYELVSESGAPDFTFETLYILNDQSLNAVFNNIYDNELIATSLQTVSQKLKHRILNVLPDSRQLGIKEEEDRLRGIAMSDVRWAQKRVVKVVSSLLDDGSLFIDLPETDIIL